MEVILTKMAWMEVYTILLSTRIWKTQTIMYPLNYQYIAPAGTTVIAKIENVNDCIKTARVELAAASFLS